MLKSKQRHDACKVLAQSSEPVLAVPKPSSLKIDLKAPMLLFRTLYKSFVGLVQFRRYCGLKLKHPIFGWNQIFPGQLKVNSDISLIYRQKFGCISFPVVLRLSGKRVGFKSIQRLLFRLAIQKFYGNRY